MLTETETPTVDERSAEEQRGRAPFFNSPRREVPEPRESRSPEHEPAFKEYLPEPTFIETIEGQLNDFRFPSKIVKDRRTKKEKVVSKGYRELKGSEISSIPSVERQVAYVEGLMETWLRDTIDHASSVGFDQRDPELIAAADQIESFVAQAHATGEQKGYWDKFYRRSETGPNGEERYVNESGRFVKWVQGRRVGETLAPLVARRQHADRRKVTATGIQLTLPRDNSDLARNPKVRERAYRARMDAKIGLAAARVFTEDRLALLSEILPYPPDDYATPNVIKRTASRRNAATPAMPDINELLDGLQLPELPEWEPNYDHDLIPF